MNELMGTILGMISSGVLMSFLTWIFTFKYTKSSLKTKTVSDKLDGYDKIIESQNNLIKKQVEEMDKLRTYIIKLEEKIESLEKRIKNE